MNALNILLKLDLENFENPEIFHKVIDECYEICKKTESLNKLKIGGQTIAFLLEKVDLSPETFKNKYRSIIELFMFSDYPIVRKEFFENFYLFLICSGDLLFEEKDVEEMSEVISNIDISERGD